MNLDILQMQSKPYQTWTASDVGTWLTFLGLGDYKAVFESNLVSGAELEDLTEEDLGVMGIMKLGHRKRILKKIQILKQAGSGAAWDTSSADSSDSVSSHSDLSIGSYHSTDSMASTNSDGKNLPTKYAVKCSYNGEIRAFFLKHISFRELNKAVQKEYGKKFRFKFRESTGELLTVRSDDDLAECFRISDTKTSVKLELTRRVEGLSKSETALLEDLVDAVVVSDTKGKIVFVNKATERMFAYNRNDLLKKDVNVLMPEALAKKHKKFMRNYLETGQKKVIGTGRSVTGKSKTGEEFPVWLSIAETKGRGFTATFRRMEGEPTPSVTYISPNNVPSGVTDSSLPSNIFQPLDNLIDMAVVINEKGTIIYCNKATMTNLSFMSSDLMGKNVKVIMPSPFAEEHDGYLRNFITTGKAKVMGKGREVVAKAKDGSLCRVFLSLSEQTSNGQRMFTGILRKIEDDDDAPQKSNEKSVIQQEREVLEHLLIPAVVSDEKGIINVFNPAAQKLFGFTLTEVLGRNVRVLMTDIDREKHDDYLRRYLSSDEKAKKNSKVVGHNRPIIAQHKDGSIISAKLSVTIRHDGAKTYFTALFHAE